MSRARVTSSLAVALMLTAFGTSAHHDVSGDLDERLTIEGRITDLEWTPPHVVIHVTVSDSGGVQRVWRVQTGMPNSLLRNGVTREFLRRVGEVEVDLYRSRSTDCRTTCSGYGLRMVFPDGDAVPLGEDPL